MVNLEDVLNKEPTLTALGIESRSTAHTESLPDPKEVQLCVEWLLSKKLVFTKKANFNSISIKQRIEQELKTYVTSGAAIAALIHLGIPNERIPDSPYVMVFLSQKEIFGKPKAA